MRAATRDKLLFVGLAAAYSLALFLLFYALSRRITIPDLAGAIIPVIGVIAAARGFPWRRKAVYLGYTLAGLVVLYAFLAFSGADRSVVAPLDIRDTPITALVPNLIYTVVIPFVYPVVILLLFVGNHPTRLWESRHYHGGGHRHHNHGLRGKTKRRTG